MHGKGTAVRDPAWALCFGWAVICAVPAYALLVTTDASPPIACLLASIFGVGFALGGIALHLGVTGEASPRLSLLGAIANTAAAVELLAMALVQIAVTTVAPHPGRTMGAIWLGLDVAWDVFGGAGTVLFGFALWRRPGAGRALGLAGIVLGVLLLILNIGTFPIPPANAGWFDIGPFVALWYLVLALHVLWLAWPRRAAPTAQIASAPAPGAPVEPLAGAGAQR